MTPPRTTKASSPAAALPLLLIILIDSMGFAMLTPLLAAELAPDSASAIGRGLSEDARYIIYGVATGLYPMMMFFGAPILGQLSDRIGRKVVLLVCTGGIILSYATLSAAFTLGSVVLVMLGRALGGTTAARQPISLAALVDVSTPEKRDFWLSMGLLASSVGFVVGPALSGLLSDNRIVSRSSTNPPFCHRSAWRVKFPASDVAFPRPASGKIGQGTHPAFSAERVAQSGLGLPEIWTP